MISIVLRCSSAGLFGVSGHAKAVFEFVQHPDRSLAEVDQHHHRVKPEVRDFTDQRIVARRRFDVFCRNDCFCCFFSDTSSECDRGPLHTNGRRTTTSGRRLRRASRTSVSCSENVHRNAHARAISIEPITAAQNPNRDRHRLIRAARRIGDGRPQQGAADDEQYCAEPAPTLTARS
mgnify:CR=1 FL=1